MSTAEEGCVTLGKAGEGDGFVWGACVWDLADNELARLFEERAPPLPDMKRRRRGCWRTRDGGAGWDGGDVGDDEERMNVGEESQFWRSLTLNCRSTRPRATVRNTRPRNA